MLAPLKLRQNGKNPPKQQLAFVQAFSFFFGGSEIGDESVMTSSRTAIFSIGKSQVRTQVPQRSTEHLDFLIAWTHSLLLFEMSTNFSAEDPLIKIHQSQEISALLKDGLQGKKIPILFSQVCFKGKVSSVSPWPWVAHAKNKIKRGHCVPRELQCREYPVLFFELFLFRVWTAPRRYIIHSPLELVWALSPTTRLELAQTK